MNPLVSDRRGDLMISVIIPTLNEAKNLPHVLPLIPDWVDEVLIVDGHSTDDTVEVARQLREDVRIVMQQGRGKGDALRCGFAAAAGDILIMLDADGSTDPCEIPAFVGGLMAGADYVKGSRFLQGGGTADMPLYRKLGNLGFVVTVRLLFGGSYTDLCYGYNAFYARVLAQIDLDGDGFEQTGWALLYLHVSAESAVPVGTWVGMGDHLGHPSCEGGHATGTHVHIARKFNGEWIAADSPMPFNLSGWAAHAASTAYYGNLTRGDETITASMGSSQQSILQRTLDDPVNP